jgi:hypothetical protein
MLALVAMKGAIPRYEYLDESVVRVEPDLEPVSTEAGARLLASRPKPLTCFAENVDGVLVVTCEALSDASDTERERYARSQQLVEEIGGTFGHLDQRYGVADHLIAVFGRTASLFVSIAVARRWFADYQIDFANARMDDVGNEFVRDNPQYEEAKRRGAKGIMQFSSPADHVMTLEGQHFLFPLPETASAEEREQLEEGMIDVAKCMLFQIDDERELAAEERELAERGELAAESLNKRRYDPWPRLYRVLASQMRHFFAGRQPPPDVAKFIEACKRE